MTMMAMTPLMMMTSEVFLSVEGVLGPGTANTQTHPPTHTVLPLLLLYTHPHPHLTLDRFDRSSLLSLLVTSSSSSIAASPQFQQPQRPLSHLQTNALTPTHTHTHRETVPTL